MNCSNSIEHTVEAGDTLYKLSRQYKTTVSSIILSNPRINPYNLQIGMKIEYARAENTQDRKCLETQEIPGFPITMEKEI
mgnify:CR=1 FL=1